MAGIEFLRSTDRARFATPLADFATVSQPLELRRDPLLGHTAILNPALADKAPLLFPPVDRAWLAEWVEKSRSGCVFCPSGLAATPKFDPHLVPEGQIRVGEAVAMPNLFPLARHHAVAVVGASHFLELSGFTPARLQETFTALHRLGAALAGRDPVSAYLVVAANYLFPAGASLIHPHFQLLAGAEPHAHQAQLCRAWADWHARHGGVFADALVETERTLGERYLGQTGRWHWLAAFAPLGLHEIQAVHTEAARFDRLGESDLSALADGLSRALRVYEGLGHVSFNFALYSQPDTPGARLFLRLIARQHPTPAYRNDDYFLQRLLGTELILLAPEELARRARPLFP